MRGRVQEVAPFAKSLNDELVPRLGISRDCGARNWRGKKNLLRVVEFPNSFFQIPDTTVNELGALAARAGREVVAFNQSHLQAARSGIQGDTSTSSSTADDQEIVGVVTISVTSCRIV